MICFEILINGKPRCRAGAEDLQALTTFIAWARKSSAGTADAHAELHITVGGMTQERQRPQWLSASLSVGDELTIRIVESLEADEPEMRKSVPDELVEDIQGLVGKFKDLGPF